MKSDGKFVEHATTTGSIHPATVVFARLGKGGGGGEERDVREGSRKRNRAFSGAATKPPPPPPTSAPLAFREPLKIFLQPPRCRDISCLRTDDNTSLSTPSAELSLQSVFLPLPRSSSPLLSSPLISPGDIERFHQFLELFRILNLAKI